MKANIVPNVEGKKLIMYLIIIILVMTVFFVGGLLYLESLNPDLPIETIENVFTDINGDGKVDFIVSSDVIFNTEATNFTSGQ